MIRTAVIEIVLSNIRSTEYSIMLSRLSVIVSEHFPKINMDYRLYQLGLY